MRENLTYGLTRGQGKQSGKYRNCALVLLYKVSEDKFFFVNLSDFRKR